jgi:hypothetical protein
MGDARPVLPNVIVAVLFHRKPWRGEGFQQFKSLTALIGKTVGQTVVFRCPA